MMSTRLPTPAQNEVTAAIADVSDFTAHLFEKAAREIMHIL
jgi:hypothetical protein